MTDTEQIQKQYEKMCIAMIRKDEAALNAVLDEGFVLVHMTGMRQSKAAFIGAVMDGTLNYFSARHEGLSVTANGDTATIIAQSRVAAAVFGGGRGTWRLQQRMMGSELHLHMNAGGQDIVAIIPTTELEGKDVSNGSVMKFHFPAKLIHLFNKETEENLL